MSLIIAIDPGTTDGAYVILDLENKAIVDKSILPNDKLLDFLRQQEVSRELFVEKLMCYGAPVGAETFETAYWIGRTQEVCFQRDISITLIPRLSVKLHHTHSTKAKDANIRQALIDKYGQVGTKKNPGPLFGIATHLWSALAIGTYVAEKRHLVAAGMETY